MIDKTEIPVDSAILPYNERIITTYNKSLLCIIIQCIIQFNFIYTVKS